MKYSYSKFKLAELFREYWNDFITVEGFASFYGIDKNRAHRLINAGRKAHNLGCREQ